MRALVPAIRQPEREADSSRLYSLQVRNVWNFTLTLHTGTLYSPRSADFMQPRSCSSLTTSRILMVRRKKTAGFNCQPVQT